MVNLLIRIALNAVPKNWIDQKVTFPAKVVPLSLEVESERSAMAELEVDENGRVVLGVVRISTPFEHTV